MAKPNLVAQEDFEMNNRMIEKLFERVSERLDDVETFVDDHEEFDPTDHEERLEKLQDEIDQHESNIDDLEDSLKDLETNLENIEGDLGLDIKALQRDGHRFGQMIDGHARELMQFRTLTFFGRLMWLLTGKL